MSKLDVAHSFIQRAQASHTDLELRQLLEDVTFEFGFRYFALVHHVDLRRQSPDAFRLENYPQAWSSHFVEKGLYAEDPIHRACLRSNIGFTWAEVPRKIPITTRQRSILEQAAKHGLGEGYTVPANIPGETSGSCSFATKSGIALPTENLLMADLIGRFAFQTARNLNQDSSAAPRPGPYLTPRQRDCLLLVAQGKTDWEIGRILNLSEETVGQHLDTARERYGVTTRAQLVIHAIFDGQISFTEAMSWQFPRTRE